MWIPHHRAINCLRSRWRESRYKDAAVRKSLADTVIELYHMFIAKSNLFYKQKRRFLPTLKNGVSTPKNLMKLLRARCYSADANLTGSPGLTSAVRCLGIGSIARHLRVGGVLTYRLKALPDTCVLAMCPLFPGVG